LSFFFFAMFQTDLPLLLLLFPVAFGHETAVITRPALAGRGDHRLQQKKTRSHTPSVREAGEPRQKPKTGASKYIA